MSSTGLMLTPPADRTQQTIESLRRDNYMLGCQVEELREQLRQEKLKAVSVGRGVTQLREILSPMFNGLKMVFGEIDAMGVVDAPSAPDSRVAAIWSDWKQKFPGHPSRAIDALLLHGSMTQGQLRIAVGCATGTISNVVSILNRAGLINKNGGKISLKEL